VLHSSLRRITAHAVLGTALACATLLPGAALAKQAAAQAASLDPVAAASLPKQARDTLALIKQGGPFPYKKDGSTFGNREGILPKKPRGYYSEYTVKTPFSRDRGARRIVAGKGSTGDPASSGEYYYTSDHYASFKRIVE
jgi:ribonuclease T1